MMERKTLADIIGRDSFSSLINIHKSMESKGKRFNKTDIEALQKKVKATAFDYDFGATVITIDGLKASGKTTLRQKLQSDLEKSEIKTFFFRESMYADPVLREKWRDFRKSYGYGGNPFDSATYISDMRVSAFSKPEVQYNFANKNTVILYERSYVYTLACALACSLTEFNEDRPKMFPFLDRILYEMDNTFVIPDFSIILQIGHKTMTRRVKERNLRIGREDFSGLPPRNVGRALFQFGEVGSNGETILPNVFRISSNDMNSWSDDARQSFFNGVYSNIKEKVYEKLVENGFKIDDK